MYPEVKKILTVEEQKEVINAATKDDHSIHLPTHKIVKNGEVVGAWSLGSIPLVMTWNDTKKINSRESLLIQNAINSIMNDRGQEQYFIACDENSNYRKYMERCGYKLFWKTDIFVKG